MTQPIAEPIFHLGADAVIRLVEYCREKSYRDLALIADQNTYSVLGEHIQHSLQADGCQVLTILLHGDPVLAGEGAVFQMLNELPDRPVTCLAVGSGTITDVVRFTSHRTRNRFLSAPTAPSVDGYTSANAPLIHNGFKSSYQAHAPEAIFAHLPTLAGSPAELIASGLGDMLGKFIAAADWRLGALLWDEPFDAVNADHTWQALQQCVAQADSLCDRDPHSIRLLMEGLIESGLSMLRVGNSNPASGAEHHISHFLEMKHTLENGAHHLHGATVGLASIYMAEHYQHLRALTRDRAASLLANQSLPDPAAEIERIRAVYGSLADAAIREIDDYLYMTEERYQRLKADIINHWDEIQNFARLVPEPQQMRDWLQSAGGAVTPQALGITSEEMDTAINNAHYLRRRFTITKLWHYFGLEATPAPDS
jgi:glycerol-1-phosphate dehydrogenase [NAD(P)+]